MTVSYQFTDRILDHPRILSAERRRYLPPVLAAKDQLLACGPAVGQLLTSQLGLQWDIITTLLAGLPEKGHASHDVDILQVHLQPGQNIFQVTHQLRSHLPHPRDVSPNHVLIPAPTDASCPDGPPHPSRIVGTLSPAPPGVQPVHVTVIDSGYQWDPAWVTAPNPIAGYIQAGSPAEGDWIDRRRWAPGVPPANVWAPGVPDVTDANADGNLDALAGHSNFIAGVIAQNCPQAQITIRNHNGGFAYDPSDDNAPDLFPTEAAVVRTLCQSHAADVIELGFAFVAYENVISCAWDLAFQLINRQRAPQQFPIVVSPAGNQDDQVPRYPAALDWSPGGFPTMIGVGSYPAPTDFLHKNFSNHGPWLTCSTNGNDVLSTFLEVDMPVEEWTPPWWQIWRGRWEWPQRPRQDFSNAWAIWNGTSFAAPQVVAAIANAIPANGGSPPNAWDAVKQGNQVVNNYGVIIP
jgi:subtilase family protein